MLAMAVARYRLPLTLSAPLILLLLAACGGENNAGGTARPAVDPPAAPHLGELPAALPLLPCPADVPRVASDPPTDEDRCCCGAEYDPALPHNNAFSFGSEVLLNPDWDPGSATDLSGLAYATYRFCNLQEYAGMARLKLCWLTEPADYVNAYLALADFDQNAWCWYALPDGGCLDVTGFDACISGGGELLAVVLLTGTDSASLRWLIVGDRLCPVAWINTDLDPNPGQNEAPLTANFDGTASSVKGGEIVAWDFDFEDDGTYDVTGNTDGLAQFTYTELGEATCRMRVHDDIDQQDETSVSFWVVDPDNLAPTAVLSLDPDFGTAPFSVDLDASASIDDKAIVRYEWDMDDDGVFEYDTDDSPYLTYVFGVNGLNDITLKVTDQDFSYDTQRDTVTVFGGFRRATVASGYQIATQTSAGICGTGVTARACVAWQDFYNLDLKFAAATNIQASMWGEPVSAAPTDDDTGFSPSLCTGTGAYPQIAFGKRGYDLEYDLQFVRATEIDGSAWAEPLTVSEDHHTGGDNALAMVSAVPTIATVAEVGHYGHTSLYFYAAEDATGTTWDTGVEVLQMPEDGILQAVGLVGASATIYDIPLISFARHVSSPVQELQIGAVGAIDIGWTDWGDPVYFDNYDARTTSLAVVGGNPALTAGSHAQGGCLYFGRALDNAGIGWPEDLDEIASGGHGGYCDLEIVNALPGMCYYSFEGQDLWYIEAADTLGTAWNEPFIVASSGMVGAYCSMTVHSNTVPIIVYYDETNDNLMAAYWVE